jgi:hypothetical protein
VHATLHHSAVLHHRFVHRGHAVVDELGDFRGVLLQRGFGNLRIV